MQHRVISLKNAAEAAGVSLSTIKRLIASGALRKVRVSEARVGVFEAEPSDRKLFIPQAIGCSRSNTTEEFLVVLVDTRALASDPFQVVVACSP